MTILAALFAILFGKLLGRWRGALVAVLGIAFYSVLVGMNAAVVRAAILVFATAPEKYNQQLRLLNG